MSINDAVNTILSDASTRFCVEATQSAVDFVLAQKRRRRYRLRMARVLSKSDSAALAKISPKHITAACELAGFKSPKGPVNWSAVARTVGSYQAAASRVKLGTAGDYEKWQYVQAFANQLWTVAVEGKLTELEKALRVLGLQPKSEDDMTDFVPHLTPAPDRRGAIEDLPLYLPQDAGGGIMSFRTTTAKIGRPQTLVGIEDAYAFQMIGDSASPRYEPGETIYVNPTLKPELGRWCVFFMADNETARVGKLVGISAEVWQIEQSNPRGQQQLPRAEWPHCHRIKGTDTP